MPQIFINKITGVMAEIPADGNCGVAGNNNLTNPDVTTKLIGGDLAIHFSLNHCKYEDGEIIIKPENEWSENIIDEVEE